MNYDGQDGNGNGSCDMHSSLDEGDDFVEVYDRAAERRLDFRHQVRHQAESATRALANLKSTNERYTAELEGQCRALRIERYKLEKELEKFQSLAVGGYPVTIDGQSDDNLIITFEGGAKVALGASSVPGVVHVLTWNKCDIHVDDPSNEVTLYLGRRP